MDATLRRRAHRAETMQGGTDGIGGIAGTSTVPLLLRTAAIPGTPGIAVRRFLRACWICSGLKSSKSSTVTSPSCANHTLAWLVSPIWGAFVKKAVSSAGENAIVLFSGNKDTMVSI